MQNNLYINKYNHGDLHNYNWKITNDNKIVIYDYGLCWELLDDFLLENLNNLLESLTSNFLLKGSSVQKKVWLELKKIKFGKTKSYGEIAKKLKLSPRHIGKICAQNRIPLFIPCHRVIRSNGSIGGFSAIGGIILKKKLLDFEKN